MQAVVVARLIFCAEVRVVCFVEQGVFHELLFDLILILILCVGLIGAATATPRSPCLTHCRQ